MDKMEMTMADLAAGISEAYERGYSKGRRDGERIQAKKHGFRHKGVLCDMMEKLDPIPGEEVESHE